MLQSLAFVSFMWEESLQTAGFACKAAMDAKHEPTATAAVAQYASIMGKAQQWQSHVGWLGLWAHSSYYAYFYLAAPTQLQSFKARQQQLWPVDRTLVKEDTWGGAQANRRGVQAEIVGKKVDPMHPQAWAARGAAALAGFDPWLRWPMGSIPGDEGENEKPMVSTTKPDSSMPAAVQVEVPEKVTTTREPTSRPAVVRCKGIARSTKQQCRCSTGGDPSGYCRFHRPGLEPGG
jgi:hypothetical protein